MNCVEDILLFLCYILYNFSEDSTIPKFTHPGQIHSLYSRIPLSRAPLTHENQLAALAPWTPNFSDATLATAPMTDPVTHMCWSEQISPLAYSSQATWQPFDLSHCIEIRNTHPLSRAGQLSQTYITHSAPILAPRNQPPTVNKQWPPLRESRMSRHTRFNPAKKRKLPRCTVYFLVQIQFTGRYGHWPDSDFVFLLCRKCQNLSYLKYNSGICHREAHATLVKPAAPARRHFCFLSSRDVVWLISSQKPSCVALRNVWFDSFVA